MIKKFLRHLIRHKLQLLIVAAAFALLPALTHLATETRKTASNQVIDWLPSGSEETRVFFEYLGHFAEGELLMLSWDGAELGDERFSRIAERLLTRQDQAEYPYFDKVLTSDAVLDSLIDEPLLLSDEEAMERLNGWLLGRNNRDACLVAVISEYGTWHRTEAIDLVDRSVREVTGLPYERIQVAGPTTDSIAIDRISSESQKQLLPIFLILCLVMLLIFLRSFIAACFVFLIASTNSELGPSLIGLTGGHMDSISMLISSLVYVLTISAGIYLTNYYRETLRTLPPRKAIWVAIRKALLPCFLSMLTTVLGMSSLCISKMVPIRNFGFYSSLTLVLGTAWLFVTFSATIQLFPIRRWRWLELKKPNATFQHRLQDFWRILAGWVRYFRTPIVVLALLVILVLALGLPDLKTTVTFHGMFRPNAKVIRDYDTLENRIGGLIPIEVVLDIPAATDAEPSILEELWLLQDAETILRDVPEVDSVISALNFAPVLPGRDAQSIGSTVRRVVYERKLSRNADEFKRIRFLDHVTDEDGTVTRSLWRISLRIPAHSHIQYDRLLAEIRGHLEGIVAQANDQGQPDVRFVVTGGVPLVHKAQSQLLSDLISSFLTAFLTISLTMIVMLRGVLRGLVAMIPNIFPCVVVFGLMGWLGKPVDMGSMMTASVAIGIAVDGTLHFMTWFRRGIDEGLSHAEAVTHAYQHCATAMTQTTLICSFGMLVFCFSGFLPVAKFATLLFWLLMTALAGGLILLPALLYGPLGKVFERR